MERFPDHDVEKAIEHSASDIIEQVLWYLAEERTLYRDRIMEIISEHQGVETAAIGLLMEQQLQVIETGADDHGFGDLTFTLENLRGELESYAVLFIHLLAESKVSTMFEELFEFMEEHDLGPEQLRDANNFGWLPHVREREEGSSCTVYEYRDVEEPGRHVDVWEYQFQGGDRIYIEVHL